MLNIKGKRINLIIPTMKHVDHIVKHANDEDVAKYLENLPYPYKRKDGVFFVKKMVKKGVISKTDYHFSIFEKEKNEVIGGIGFHKINKKHNNTEVGYWLGKKYWRQGYGLEALRLILGFGFNRLKLNKIYASAYGPNIASQKLLKKAGFKQEGQFRKQLYKHNKWHDEFRFGILKEEYDKQN